jgi:monofunctional biosynthetic peptidoglycan transglycosylase
MDRIHARLPDGTLVEGVEVFRRLYAAVGFGPLVALTRLPGIAWLLDRLYRWFARNRLRLTGRCVDGACEVRQVPAQPHVPAATTAPSTIVAFGTGAVRWHDLSDPVMGGVSHGELVVVSGVGIFRGVVSLEHDGGFASVRSTAGRYDLSGYAGLSVRVRGDGKRYGLRLRTDESFDGVNYQIDLDPGAGEWRDLELPFAGFRPVHRGRLVAGHPPLDPAAITTFGLIIAGRQAGPFRLEIASIAGYGEAPAVRW